MIDLPATPGPVEQAWSQIDYGGVLTGPLGGEDQRLNRLGNRLMVEVPLPPQRPGDAAEWVVALNLGLTQGARWLIRQVEFDVGAPGLPVVDGSGSGGGSLPIRSAQPGYAFRAGQYVNVVVGGRRATHMIAAQSIVGSNGKATLSVLPWLRVPPSDGDSVLVAGVTIEGLLQGDGFAWSIDRVRRVGASFTIKEQR